MIRRIIARAPTYIADAAQDPKWLVMFAFGRFMMFRRLAWPSPVGEEPSDQPAGGSLFTASLPSVLHDLRTDGISTGLMLPPEHVAAIRQFAESHPCFGNFNRDLAFLPEAHREAEARAGKPILTGHYLESVEQCPSVDLIRSDPLILRIAERYLASTPKPISTRLWWSFPAAAPSEQDLHHASQGKMHFDLDDWRTLKFFFYLTDVGPADGPHVYMRGSHERRKWRHQFTPVVGHDTAEVVAAYGRDNLFEVCGAAGFGFAEDSFAFHMGQVSRGKPRLMLEVGFGVSSAPSRRFHGELVLH
ncbi:MAG: hypothetical protein JOZ42_03750 [Acetobacteraceae bacterium]|nr:hypothetical protein [Acetobacteraceae bacterium]